MAYTSKDFNREVDKAIKSGLENGVPPQAMFAKLALSGQEMGNYHIHQAREKMIAEQKKASDTGLVNLNGQKIKSN